ncbi:uncharacterized protein PITG_08502 [Phytophthora infestans T30-4]|uniref:Uncharacterized protein n=1 Tax=Phytophthora infestans (strain T30-4) TaxID=403677 RepID=D0NAS2_PHYIT|nr:uncharacterized protein PITG_08502 [Phytophthora infestans T30-4]EEY54930.1 conserved hypothetical protein [Phytophthora infestans T30-4]|eukprot:XP_002903875.1 conserved hypothetical protein [Phytophthora infestans T30-4]
MLQFMTPNEDATEIERFRARHRRLLRRQQQQHSPAKVKDLDEDDGRRRKVSANWRRKQQEQQHQSDDSHWCQSMSAGDGFNAFDFSTSPEAFHDEPDIPLQSCVALQDEQRMADVAKQVTSMGFHCNNMWQPAGISNCPPPSSTNQRPTVYFQSQYFG